MATVLKFSRPMLESWAKSNNLRYLKDSDGDVRVGFSYDDDSGCALTLWLMAGGKQNEILVARMHSDRRIPKSDWGRAVMLCNTWNKERRWPKAYLDIDDTATSTSGEIILEEQIDCEQGIHQELVNDFIDHVVIGGNMFWEWAHKEQGY